MLLSATFPPSSATPEHIAVAEDHGFARAWVYDSPALYGDAWMALARAADRTTRIGLGPAVLVPSLRHVVVNAAAVLSLESLAPGRVAVCLGTGFTGRLPLDRPGAMKWADVEEYVRALRALLAGDDATLDGDVLGLLQAPEFGPARPVAVPVLLGADGPRGASIAAEIADGVIVTRARAQNPPDAAWVTLFDFAYVTDEGDDAATTLDAMGWVPSLAYHGAYGAGRVEALPEGDRWRAAVEEVPEHRRHLAVHEGHMVGPNPVDRVVSEGTRAALLPAMATVGDTGVLAEYLRGLAERGVDEVAVHVPVGHERTALERLARAAEGVVTAPSTGTGPVVATA